MEETQNADRMTFMVPYGFRFNPKDQEIIYLLLRKTNGNSIPVDEALIEERDLFGKEKPLEIFGRWTEKTRYFFTKLKKKSKRNGCNVVRTAGKGTWKGQDGRGRFPITDHEGRVIGFKKNLFYKGKGTDTNGRWLMKEYHLDGVSLEPQPKFNDYVLCAIRKKDDGRKQEKQNDDLGFKADTSSTEGNQDGEGFGSGNYAENSILGGKRPRIEYVEQEKVDETKIPNIDYELPNDYFNIPELSNFMWEQFLILDDELDQPNVMQDHAIEPTVLGCDKGIRTPGSGLSDQ